MDGSEACITCPSSCSSSDLPLCFYFLITQLELSLKFLRAEFVLLPYMAYIT